MARIRMVYDTLRPGLRKFPSEVDRAISASVNRSASKGETHMKTHAPWTDRTTLARTTLGAVAFSENPKYVIVLFGGAPYQIWLEIAMNGRYAIIIPSLLRVGYETMDDLRMLFRRMRG